MRLFPPRRRNLVAGRRSRPRRFRPADRRQGRTLVERKASIRYDGAIVDAACHRTGRGHACTYAVTGDDCRGDTRATATVARRPGGRARVTLEVSVTSFCDGG